MSLKKKLVATIGMFCLTCALLLVGVWAISSTSVEIGGTISFNATNIWATVTGQIDGAKAGTVNPDSLVYTVDSQPTDDQLATWKKDLSFKDSGDAITYTITITNDSESRSLMASVVDNSVMGSSIEQAITITVNGVSQTYVSGKEYEVEPQKTAVVIATFTVDPDVSEVGTYGFEVNLRDELAPVIGSEENPYVVSDLEGFTTMLADAGSVKAVECFDAEGNTVAEADAERKVESYPSIDLVYTRASNGNWASPTIVKTATVNVELEEDVDFTSLNMQRGVIEDLSAGYISLKLDGKGHKITGLDGTRFEANGNALFDTLIDSEIKNVEFVSVNELTSIASVARGTLLLEDVIASAEGQMMFADPEDGDRNRGVFINFALGARYAGETNIVFRRCTNNVDIFSTASYNGVFIGGYSQKYTENGVTKYPKVTFDSCVNNGDITSTGKVGLFFGNSSTNIFTKEEVEAFDFENLTISNCVNNGVITGKAGSHILCADVSGGLTSGHLGILDNGRDGVISTTSEKLKEYVSKYTLSNAGHDLLVEGTEGFDLANYDYEIVMWKSVSYRDANKGGIRATLTFNTTNGMLAMADDKLKAQDVFYDFYTLSALKGHNPDFQLPAEATNLTEYASGGVVGTDYSGIYKYVGPVTINHAFRTAEGNELVELTHNYSGLMIIDDTISNGGLYCEARYNPANRVQNPAEKSVNFRLIITEKATGQIVEVVTQELLSSSADV